MKPATTGGAPYKVPREHDGWRSLTLAAAMHALLVLFLWFGVHWQSNKPRHRRRLPRRRPSRKSSRS